MSLVYTPDPIQISGTFPSPIPVLVLVSTMAASLKEAWPMCSVLPLTFNKCNHIKETKSIIVPVINSRTFNDIFDEHHDFGFKNNRCKVMSQSHVVTPALTVGEVVSLFNVRQLTSHVGVGYREKIKVLSNCLKIAAEKADVQAVNAFQVLMAGGRSNFSASFMSDVRKSLNYNNTHLAYMLQSSVHLVTC